jgi:chromosome segregation ATPase
MADQTKNPVDDRTKELEAQLQAVEATHTAQAKRGDELERKLKDAQGKLEFQRKRADKLEALAKLAEESNFVALEGKSYPIKGVFRADSTFVEVKRGHCDEGVTLIAIDRIG